MKLLGQPVSPSNEILSWSTYEQPFTLVTLSCRSVGLCANLSVVLCCTLTSRQLLVVPTMVAFPIPLGGAAKHKPALYFIAASTTSQQEGLADPIALLTITGFC